MSAAKTTVERVSDSNERKTAAGLRQVRSLWAYPEDIPAIRKEAARLTAEREAARTEAAAKLTAKRTQPTTRRKKP